MGSRELRYEQTCRKKKEPERKESAGKVELIATHRDKLNKIKKIYSNNCEL